MDLRWHFGADLGVKGKCGGWFLVFFSSFFQSPGVPQCTLGLGPLCKGDTQVARGCGGGLWGWTGGLWGCTGGLWGCRGVTGVYGAAEGYLGVYGGAQGSTALHGGVSVGLQKGAKRCRGVQWGAQGSVGVCTGGSLEVQGHLKWAAATARAAVTHHRPTNLSPGP